MSTKRKSVCSNCHASCDARVALCRPCSDAARRSSPKDRLLEKVRSAPNGCWEFTGFRLPNGYGRIKGEKCCQLAHRLSWEVHFGAIPEAMLVCHRCDNPGCVNPEHLFLGTASDNMRDMRNKGRQGHCDALPSTRGERHWKAVLTEQQVRQILERRNEPRKTIAREFGVSPQYVSSIINGRKWKWLQPTTS